MDPKALEKARIRLRVATKQAAALKRCESYSDFAEAWYSFLHASKAIYTVLEQGAKATPQARQWFGAKNEERKDDCLLRYVTEARNDDEHGLETGAQHVKGSVALGIASAESSTEMIDQFGNVYENNKVVFFSEGGLPANAPRLIALDNKPIMARVIPEHVKLTVVHDRSRRPYDPPVQHFGTPLSPTPLVVAGLMIDYLTKLVDEAEGFCKP